MLTELRVRDLGVIEDLSLLFGPGLTAVTGETGAGKTLVVEALVLLAGGRADPGVVRSGAREAVVEARFEAGPDLDTGGGEETGTERLLTRVVPAEGRSRAQVDGAMATAGGLAEAADGLLELHGQHGHQALLAAAAQRALLDQFAGADVAALEAARRRLRAIEAELAGAGGDARARARELDLVRHQVAELEAAAVEGPDEDAALEAEEDALADAAAHRDAAAGARQALADERGAGDALAAALTALAGRRPFDALHARLLTVAAEVDDVASELRVVAEGLDDDPERLAAIRARRQLLRDLQRKYGDDLAEVLEFLRQARQRRDELEGHDAVLERLERERDAAAREVKNLESAVGTVRREAAPRLAAAVEERLRMLAMPAARLEIQVSPAAGDEVTFLLGANPGEPVAPLARAASGGELARTMLALRLVAAGGPGEMGSGARTLVFDEVDAGIGGEAAVAVGQALADLAPAHQVLVVTHLPQVAAFADQQVVVRKDVVGGRAVASAVPVDGVERVIELSRMLSGQPGSERARSHAEELLADAAQRRQDRARSRPRRARA